VENVRKNILRAAIRHYGPGAQQFKAIEELSELIRALARADDRENIAEEMADVRTMLDHLEIIFHNRDQVRKYEMEKLKRLSDRIHAADTVD
jgi:NTP pyrophosphatase (non-canonical NTP hydrolase)